MKLYDAARAPNPRRVRVFLKEKGLTVETVTVDMGAMGHRSPEITAMNPLQQLPLLEFEDGSVLTESVAICRYFEELHPDPPLFGSGARERAFVEMWNRRVELNLMASVVAAFRHLHPGMSAWEVPQVAKWGEANKPKALAFLALLDKELEGRPFIAGENYSIADITAMIAFDFMKVARIACPEEHENVWRWYRSVSARPSASA
ncbi:glutathione S-transferase [Rhizobiaceae bacterium BDR2-2]|uniref:Glutathione S-transferase n=1 Tax=Ectorhizobium quercum TaxID=2965071 RepID=A0AAE3SX31_9HYPH|nr:glutathione S-transferase [Ectorhizobium quercum]MCX8999817.1 glutathione S-transferase [Ectorhizobium quercum]